MAVKEFRLPDLGEGLEDAEIVDWRVEVGDVVALNQTLADLETAKAIVSVPSPFAGEVIERLGSVGDVLAVGSVLVRVETGEAGGDRSPGGSTSTGLDADEEPQPLVGYGQGRSGGAPLRRRRDPTVGHTTDAGPAPVSPAGEYRPVLAKPPVRKLARDLGVSLQELGLGSGPGGLITRADVEAAAHPEMPATSTGGSAAAPAGEPRRSSTGFRATRPGQVEPIRGIRRQIVQKMERSRREIPAASCTRDVDVTAMWQLAQDLTARCEDDSSNVKVTPFAVLMRATVAGLLRFPTLNARIVGREDGQEGEIHLLEGINLGFATDTERGLMVPNIKDAQHRTLVELAEGLTELGTQAREATIGVDDVTGGTFTVNNYGALGNDDGDPIINHPEVGILGIGAMRLRPWVVDGAVVVRRVATLRLVFDHRVTDGGQAGRFVTYVGDLCEDPRRILLHA